MAFPISPTINETYTTALGTVYKYNATGARWEISSQTLQGLTGLQGIQGQTGAQGFTGALGITGIPGPTGIQGIQGPRGYQGEQGYTGVRGYTGAQGHTGAQGYTGLNGPTGAFGGPQGETGLQGPTGETGAQGVTGLGVTGFIGPTGIQGTTGVSDAAPWQVWTITGINGFTGTISKTAHYKKVGNTIFCVFNLKGYSNSNDTNFELPFQNALNEKIIAPAFITENFVPQGNPGLIMNYNFADNLDIYKNWSFTGLSNTAYKDISGNFFYESFGF